MKKIVLSLILLLSFAYSQAQNRFPTTDSLQNYVLRYVKNSSVESFTNYRLQNILIGLSQMVDTLRQNGYVDSIWIGTGDTLKYRIGNSTLVIGKITGGGGGSYSFTYPLQLNTSTVSLDTTYIHSFPFYNTQYRPITWVPTLQEVTDAGNTANNDITINNLFLNGDAISTISESLNFSLRNSALVIQSDTNIVQNAPTIRFKHSTQRNFTLPNRSGTFVLDTDTSAMLSPYLRSNVAAATYQPIGSYLTSIPTLQQVTNQGNSTTDSINIIGGIKNVVVINRENIFSDNWYGKIALHSDVNTENTEIDFNSISFTKPNGNRLTLTSMGSEINNISFPDSSGTLGIAARMNGTTYMANTSGVIDLGTIDSNYFGGTGQWKTQVDAAANGNYNSISAVGDTAFSLNRPNGLKDTVSFSGPSWVDYSNTSTIVGWSSYTDKVIKYKIIGKTMFVIGVISGTSNSATTSFTIPNNAAVSISTNTSVCINSGGISIGYGGATSGSNVIAFSRFTALNTVSSSWTNSGTKQINFNFIIEIQ